ncbi:DNA-binding response OmpR family regulator [Rhodovulum imhoffii]|uniref:DNA-binding response OmpR family regulator n=1 Tax=Rhodovulum imhoffii TaxID=365340 RepID=A0A2T5BWL1_9RHOB|nr:response regulator transcription factor [Rhodovulum imhoffii]MBK5933287.1 two-component system response regulator [Rhodovulum imhoffii]PTN04045.1 DNA-binding response OmpR family regulator [Rhodovulum imhoffii]
MKNRILIVDDDPEITSALVRGLHLFGYEAEASNRADHALELLESGTFSVAIVDVMLGADSGQDLVRNARARGATLPILMLSALSDVEDRAAGLEAGANDYVVKPFSLDELVARLKVQELRAEQTQPLPATLCLSARSLSRGRARADLTERETALLVLLIRNAGSPLPRGTIFDALWAVDGSVSENVVDVYIGYLRKKLKRDDFGFEIRTLRNQGFQIDGLIPRCDRG